MLVVQRTLVVLSPLQPCRLPRPRSSVSRPDRLAGRPVTRRHAEPGKNEPEVKPVDGEWVQEVAKELTDTSRLGKRGEAYFVAQIVSLLLVVWAPDFLRPLLGVAGWGAILGGLAMVFAGQQALGSNLTPLPQPRESGTLVTSGIFQYVRHPMYGGLLLAALGFSMASGDELRLVLAGLAFVVLDRKSGLEEALLAEKFGKEYEELQQRTKKLIPYIY